MKKQVTPYVFEGFLIIALHSDWIKAFDGIPDFDVAINDKKLQITSIKTIKNKETERD